MMRIWGRVYDELDNATWTAVETAPDGSNDYVYVTNLIQVLKLSRNESPFFSNYGIPGQVSVMTQSFPDFYMLETQRQFAKFFASLIVAKLPAPTPRYNVSVTTNAGVQMNAQIPV